MLMRPLLLGLGVAMLSACDEPDAGVAPAVASTTYRWMQCHDCMNGERDGVIALGDTAVPLLRKVLQDGPPDPHVATVARSLRELADRSRGRDAPDYATRVFVLSRFRSMYQLRAISALRGIGTPDAVAALCAARQRAMTRAGTSRSVTSALDSAVLRLPRPCP